MSQTATAVAERRGSTRTPAAWPVAFAVPGADGAIGGHILDTSENGVYALVGEDTKLKTGDIVEAQIVVPAAAGRTAAGQPLRRRVTYRCRVVRAQMIGRFLGIGLQYICKISEGPAE
ncbi:MAG: PilZ domain-containing protein [Planctomycetaceae bacterium]|nr:PilZ domain-containing protein [Planctomycetaceae bacterium]